LEVEDPKAAIEAGVLRLLSMQRSSGGFAYWPEDEAVNVYVSAYATWVLGLARGAGHPVDEGALYRAQHFLRERLDAAAAEAPAGRGLGPGVEAAIAVHTLADARLGAPRRADALFAGRER